jgi:hypothetical protein
VRYCYVSGGVISVYSVEELQKKSKSDKKGSAKLKKSKSKTASKEGGWTKGGLITHESTAVGSGSNADTEDEEDAEVKSGRRTGNLSAGQAGARNMYQPVQAKRFMALDGACVRELPRKELGHELCFQLVSAAGVMVLQALDETDIEQWVGLLYYATSLATNGKFVLDACRVDSSSSNEKVVLDGAMGAGHERVEGYGVSANTGQAESEGGSATGEGEDQPQTRLKPALSTGNELPHSWQQGAITALMTTSASAVVHEGWLVKSSVSLKKRKRVWAWKKRYFTLTQESEGVARLHYYTTETMNHLKGHVDITADTTVDPLDKNIGTADGTGKGRAHCIRISSFSSELIVQAASETERSDWLAVLTSSELLDGPHNADGSRISSRTMGPSGLPIVADDPAPVEEEVADHSDGWKSAKGRRVVAKKNKAPLADRLKANDPSVRLAGGHMQHRP